MPKKIVLPEIGEQWDEEKEEFFTIENPVLIIEHSLKALSKWEQIWHKPFISNEEKTLEETISYIKCMTLNEVDDRIYNFLTNKALKEIEEYISDPMTATTINDTEQPRHREVITAEILYYDLFTLGYSIEVENWHLNTLIALIRVGSIKNSPQKKMSSGEAGIYQRKLNEQRRAQMAAAKKKG